MRRKQVCARQLDAGPGSCGYWWKSCPAKVEHCFNRYIREHGRSNDGSREIDVDQARAWSHIRDGALLNPTKRASEKRHD